MNIIEKKGNRTQENKKKKLIKTSRKQAANILYN